MTSISLYTICKQPDPLWLGQALDSAAGLFDEHIIVHDLNGDGISQSRNKAVRLCSGDLIASLDCDDVLIKENVNKLKDYVQKVQADIYSFPVQFIGEQQGEWGSAISETIYTHNMIPSGSWVKKEVFDKLTYRIDPGEDWDFWARCYQAGLTFAHFPLPIYYYRIHQSNASKHWDREAGEIREKINSYLDTVNQLC